MRFFNACSTVLFLTVAVVNASKDCRFAPSFNQTQIVQDQAVRAEFTSKVLQAEGRFIKNLGVDQQSGLTLSSVPINSRTGLPIAEEANRKSVLRNEAIHIGILIKALLQDPKALEIY